MDAASSSNLARGKSNYDARRKSRGAEKTAKIVGLTDVALDTVEHVMTIEDTKSLVRRYFTAYEAGNIDAVMEFVASDHMHHPPGGDEPMDFEARRSDDLVFLSAFSDIRTRIEDVIAEGDKVASRITMHCTQTGNFHGIPPTGNRVAITFMDIARIRDGKIVEEWTEFDLASILQQLTSDPVKKTRTGVL